MDCYCLAVEMIPQLQAAPLLEETSPPQGLGFGSFRHNHCSKEQLPFGVITGGPSDKK